MEERCLFQSNYFFGLALLACSGNFSAQTRKPMTIAEIATYMGPDREQLLCASSNPLPPYQIFAPFCGDLRVDLA
jgi:hypothetical protein